MGWVVRLGRSVGGCVTRREASSVQKAQKAYSSNVLAKGEMTQRPDIYSALTASGSPLVKAAMVVIHYSYELSTIPQKLSMC